MSNTIKFAGYPDAFVYIEPNEHSKWVNHLLWGEWVQVLEEENEHWVKVNVRGAKDGWMLKTQLQENKIVELYFVDIGQGDGCLAIFPNGNDDNGVPKSRSMLIDAGQNDNMLRFINWKFNTKNDENPAFKFDDIIISHGDADHYGGFQAIFENPRFEFKNVYHNGLVERAIGESLGSQEKIGKITYQTDVIETHQELDKIISNPAAIGKRLYPKLMKTAAGRGAQIRMMCNQDAYLPDFGVENEIKIRVLAPVVEINEKHVDKRLLRRFGNDGKTKNGHSVVLQLEYGNVKILLGGDLNVPAENYLLKHYGKGDPKTNNLVEQDALITEARKYFGSDVAKACHHGSGDFSTIFLRAVNAAATIVSSGDDESHAHPRPNTLGALGKYGRGEFPLIFSTEMARSAKEKIKKPTEIQKEIEILQNEIIKLTTEIDSEKIEQKKLQLEKHKKLLFSKLGRTVEVYGMINVRTDGKNVLIAQKLEKEAERGFWDIHCLEPIKQKDGTIVLVYADNMEKHD